MRGDRGEGNRGATFIYSGLGPGSGLCAEKQERARTRWFLNQGVVLSHHSDYHLEVYNRLARKKHILEWKRATVVPLAKEGKDPARNKACHLIYPIGHVQAAAHAEGKITG